MDCARLTFEDGQSVELEVKLISPDTKMDTSRKPRRLGDSCHQAWSLKAIQDKPVLSYILPNRDWLIERTPGTFTLNGRSCKVEFFEA